MPVGMPQQHLRIAVLAARDAGLALLHELPWAQRGWQPVALATHRRLPRTEDPAGGERPEYHDYVAWAARAGVPLLAVDTRAAAAELVGLAACRPIDVLLCVSWRYLVPAGLLRWARVIAINLHRGRLPEYAGAEPVRRALEAGETEVTLSAHVMTEEIDAGPVLLERTLPVQLASDADLAAEVARIKRALLPLYAPLAVDAIDAALGVHAADTTDATNAAKAPRGAPVPNTATKRPADADATCGATRRLSPTGTGAR